MAAVGRFVLFLPLFGQDMCYGSWCRVLRMVRTDSAYNADDLWTVEPRPIGKAKRQLVAVDLGFEAPVQRTL